MNATELKFIRKVGDFFRRRAYRVVFQSAADERKYLEPMLEKDQF